MASGSALRSPARDERLELRGLERADDGARRRRAVRDRHPRKGEHRGGQARARGIGRTDVDRASAQAREARADRLADLPLHQQVERLDVERRHLPDVLEVLDPEGPGHEREIDAPGIDVRELGLGVLCRDEVHLDAARLHLARERARNHEAGGSLVARRERDAARRGRLASGGEPQAGGEREEPQRECESPESPAASAVAHERAPCFTLALRVHRTCRPRRPSLAPSCA